MESVLKMWRVKEVCLLLYLAAETARDIRIRKVSLKSSAAAGAFAGALFLWEGCSWESAVIWILGIFPGLFFLAMAFATRQAVGYGDGAAVTVTGLFLGLAGSVAVTSTALLLTCPAALILVAIKKAGRKTAMPFLPFLLAAYLLWLLL